eukprot:s2_g57.t1
MVLEEFERRLASCMEQLGGLRDASQSSRQEAATAISIQARVASLQHSLTILGSKRRGSLEGLVLQGQLDENSARGRNAKTSWIREHPRLDSMSLGTPRISFKKYGMPAD